MHRKLSWKRIFVWVSIYSIAMAYLESAVVLYLRAIYYPYGFDFPLAPIDKSIAITEIGREAATLIMLLAVGCIAGRTPLQRFAYFLYSFAIWDIFYYVFLYVLVDWPQSLLTWDILFLIPVAWIGPVIAPILLSLTMILFGLLIIRNEEMDNPVRIKAVPWIALIVGSLTVILSFTWEYTSYILEKFTFSELFMVRNEDALYEALYNYIPQKFNWLLFVLGVSIIIVVIIHIMHKWKKDETLKTETPVTVEFKNG